MVLPLLLEGIGGVLCIRPWRRAYSNDAHVAALLAKEQVIVLVALDGDAGDAVAGGLVAYQLDKLGTREDVMHFDIDVPRPQR